MKDSIPHDTYEQFIRLFVAQEGRLRAFLRTLVPSLDALVVGLVDPQQCRVQRSPQCLGGRRPGDVAAGDYVLPRA